MVRRPEPWPEPPDEHEVWEKLARQIARRQREKLMAEKPEAIKTIITETPESPKSGSTLRAPAGDTNVTVVTMTWYSQVAIRVLRTYLQGLVGFVVAGTAGMPGPLPASGFSSVLLNAASLALAPAIVSLLQNAIEILSKLDVTNPQVRA